MACTSQIQGDGVVSVIWQRNKHCWPRKGLLLLNRIHESGDRACWRRRYSWCGLCVHGCRCATKLWYQVDKIDCVLPLDLFTVNKYIQRVFGIPSLLKNIYFFNFKLIFLCIFRLFRCADAINKFFLKKKRVNNEILGTIFFLIFNYNYLVGDKEKHEICKKYAKTQKKEKKEREREWKSRTKQLQFDFDHWIKSWLNNIWWGQHQHQHHLVEF